MNKPRGSNAVQIQDPWITSQTLYHWAMQDPWIYFCFEIVPIEKKEKYRNTTEQENIDA